jgi:hypothetical protein
MSPPGGGFRDVQVQDRGSPLAGVSETYKFPHTKNR